jgi:flagellum-specific peptidoglycan hydrolase FlgJ
MEHGLLSPERAKKAYERKQKRQQQVRMGTPIKSSAVMRKDKPESSKKPSIMDSKAKRRVDYSDDDNDFIVKMKRSKG